MQEHQQKKFQKDRPSLSKEYLIITLIYALVMGFAQIVLSNASSEIADLYKTNNIFFSFLKSGWLIFGILIYIIATLFWLWILYNLDIRYAYPIASTSVVFAALIQSFYLKSFPSFTFWIGLSLILIGLTIVTNSKFN